MTDNESLKKIASPGPKVHWVDFIVYDPRGDKRTVVARCIWSDGKMSWQGERQVVETVSGEALWSPSEMRLFYPGDGLEYMRRLSDRYDSAYFFATAMEEGDEKGLKPIAS